MSDPEPPVVTNILTLARDPSQPGWYHAGEIERVEVKLFEKPTVEGFVACIETTHFTNRPGRLFHFKFMLARGSAQFFAEELPKILGGVK